MTPTKKTTTRKTAVKLPPNPFIHEVLALVDKQRTKAKKIEILEEYSSDALKSILIWNFDQTVVSMIPEGKVPYNKNEVPVGTDHTSLRREWRNLYDFVKGGNDSLSSMRRETMFIQLLEGLSAEEARFLITVVNKRVNNEYKGFTANLVKEAFNWNDNFMKNA